MDLPTPGNSSLLRISLGQKRLEGSTMIILGHIETMKGATVILIFWICLLLVLIILMIKSWIEREDCEDYDKLRYDIIQRVVPPV